MKKIISIFLCILFLLTALVGCAADKGTGAGSNNSDVVTDSEEVDADFPNIPKQDNGNRKFTILYPKWSLYDGSYYFSDGVDGDIVGMQSYTRLKAVEDHLGIEIDPMITTNDIWNGVIDVMTRIKVSGVAGTDDYQMALTHCFNGITSTATEGYLTDYGNLPNVDLDRNYWRKDQMASIAINDAMYFGSGSFIIPDPCLMLFNHDMIKSIPGLSADDLYQAVRDKKWTLEKMKQYAVNISAEDSYGFSSIVDWELIAFMTSEGYYTATKDPNGAFELLDFNEKIDRICNEVEALVEADYSYKCKDITERDKIMTSGNAMFTTAGLSYSINIISQTSHDIGILPYPSISEDVDYQNLDWSGYMVIPSTVKDQELAGAVAELLCYYGEKNVYPAFFDKLLDGRTAQKVQDVEMLDLIFDNLVYDPSLTFCNAADSHLGFLFYVVPRTVRAEGGVNVASYYEEFYAAASEMLVFS